MDLATLKRVGGLLGEGGGGGGGDAEDIKLSAQSAACVKIVGSDIDLSVRDNRDNIRVVVSEGPSSRHAGIELRVCACRACA